jgi:hypothetical protein
MIDQLKYMIEDVLIFFKTLSISSDPYSVSGTPQAPSTLAPLEPSENPLYGMPKGFTPSQAPPIMSALPSRPKTAMVISPTIFELLNSMPSLATTSRTSELANFVPPYPIVVHSTPPIPPMGTGIPRGPVSDYYFNKYSVSDRIPRTEPKRGMLILLSSV